MFSSLHAQRAVLGVAKRISQGPVANLDGTMDIAFEIRIKNLGDTNLRKLQVTENLGLVLVNISGWDIVDVESEEFNVNNNFDGVVNIGLLSGEDELGAGEEGVINLQLVLEPEPEMEGFSNQVLASAEDPEGNLITDLSHSGTDPDPDNDDDPSNNNDPTNVFLECTEDDMPPVFLNCPLEDLMVVANPEICGAIVDFTLPQAEDNCALISLEQTDNTELSTGDLFPIGLTILEYTAIDGEGNQAHCTIRVQVDGTTNSLVLDEIDFCPADLSLNAHVGLCGAVVSNIEPVFETPCSDYLSVVYSIQNENGEQVLSGINDASNNYFGLGEHMVHYRAQDQALLLITEVSQDPMNALGLGDEDLLEISNFGPSGLDLSGLSMERILENGNETFTLPSGTLLAAGEVLIIHFGNGIDAPTEGIFHLIGASNLEVDAGAAYVLSQAGKVLDVVAVGGFDPEGLGTLAVINNSDWAGRILSATGNFIRQSVWDSNAAIDFKKPDVCHAASLGQWNPEFPEIDALPAYLPLQAIPLQQAECSFRVTVEDNEAPEIGRLSAPILYASEDTITMEAGQCRELVIELEELKLADLDVNLEGESAAFGDLSYSLINPAGVEILLISEVCNAGMNFKLTLDDGAENELASNCFDLDNGKAFIPQENLSSFLGAPTEGDWTLRVAHKGAESSSPTILFSWGLEVKVLEEYDQLDVEIDNDPGVCGAEFGWNHPIFYDNCTEGTLQVFVFGDGEILISESIVPQNLWGAPTSAFFDVGEGGVTYMLTDASGNETEYSFSVLVRDAEAPRLVCPEDQTIFLEPGACSIREFPLVELYTDNCETYNLVYDPPFPSDIGIGTTAITLMGVDPEENRDSCSYNLTVVEYMPSTNFLACNGEINISLGLECEVEIVAEMMLEGNEYRCYDNYEITIYPEDEGTSGVPILSSPFVNLDHIDQRLVVEICDPDTDLCCWGYLNVVYEAVPEFIKPEDVVISCNLSYDPSNLGMPVVTSCVPGEVFMSYEDEIIEHEDCDSLRATVLRTWMVANEQGQASMDTQHIEILSFNLDLVKFPLHMDDVASPALSCDVVANNPALTSPEETGFPTLQGETFDFTDPYCSTSIFYTDEVFDLCAGSYEIHRIWKVVNTCLPVVAGENPREHIQVLKVIDREDPEIFCAEDMTVNTSPFNCQGEVILPAPTMVDACSESTYSVNVSSGALSASGETFHLSNLSMGEHVVVYRATDACNRTSECSLTIIVKDNIEPIAMAGGDVNLSMGAEGYGRLDAEAMNEGSWDNCGLDRIEVRRLYTKDSITCEPIREYYSTWAPFVEFRCCDINDEIFVEMRAVDANGNTDVSSMMVLVEDKLRPYCVAPDDVLMDCMELPADFDINDLESLQENFGIPEPIDNCIAVWEELEPAMSMENCNAGTLTRTFRAIDANGNFSANSCIQKIAISGARNYEIRFPKDTESICGTPDPDTLMYNELGCDLLAVSVDDETFSASGDECYKIERTYRVINWCEYDGEQDPIVISRDEDCDGVTGYPENDGIWVLVRPNGITYLDQDNSEINNLPTSGTKGMACDGGTNPAGFWKSSNIDSEIQSNGYWEYVQLIKVYDNIGPEVRIDTFEPFCSIDNATCEAEVSISFSVEENCTPEDIAIEVYFAAFQEEVELVTENDIAADVLEGTYPNFNITEDFPVGEHALLLVVKDGCGQFKQVEIPFVVDDCLSPTPICNNNLSVNLSPVIPSSDVNNDGESDLGAATIWASDFIASSSQDCSAPVTYSINRPGDEPEPDQLSLIVTCNDLGILFVEIYAWDDEGNHDFCLTGIVVRDNQNICGGGTVGTAAIAGGIYTPSDQFVEGVEVVVSGQQMGMVTSNEEGSFIFPSLVLGHDYTLTPGLDIDWTNGVSTFDIVKISKHILNIEALDSPYKIIAADVNNSRTVSTLDILQLRRLVLGIDTSVSNNTSWRFIDATYEFPDPTNPWIDEFPEIININNLQTEILNADFVAVKTGDINFNASSNNVMNLEERADKGPFSFQVMDQDLQAGERYSITIYANEINTIQGVQGSLAFDPLALEFIDLKSGLAQSSHLGLQLLENGGITLSWDHPDLEEGIDASKPFLTLIFEARVNGALSQYLDVNSTYIQAEAYNLQDEILDIDLVFNKGQEETKRFKLYQNQPNPYHGETVIPFYLPEQMAVSLTIHNLEGQVLYEFKQDFTAGEHEISLDRNILTANGVLYYTLKAGQFIGTKKMVVLE